MGVIYQYVFMTRSSLPLAENYSMEIKPLYFLARISEYVLNIL